MIFERCGVRIKLDARKFRLHLPIKPQARKKKDVEKFVFDPAALKGLKDPLYLMYRGVSSLREPFKGLERKYGIRYDMTLIRNGLMGRPYVRTTGHYHPGRYAEIYEVLNGRAAFLLQSRDLGRMAVAVAKKGDMVAIPPGFGHQTVNVGRTPLLIGNLVCKGFKSDYSVYKKRRGGAFYLNSWAGPWIMLNTNYGIARSKFPKIKRIRPKKAKLDKMFEKNPKKVADFLKGRGSL